VETYGTARQATGDRTIRRMLFACWINEATDTHLTYVISTAFVQQQQIRARSSILHTYIHTVSAFFCMALILVSVYVDLLVLASRVKSLLYTD
jgi:hypothetical protein